MNAKQLGQRLREARERLRMSQEDLAAIIEKDQKAISEYESGKRKLAVTDLATIAENLQCPITYFFEDTTDFQDLDQALLNYFHQFHSREDREAMVDVVRILSGIVKRNETEA